MPPRRASKAVSHSNNNSASAAGLPLADVKPERVSPDPDTPVLTASTPQTKHKVPMTNTNKGSSRDTAAAAAKRVKKEVPNETTPANKAKAKRAVKQTPNGYDRDGQAYADYARLSPFGEDPHRTRISTPNRGASFKAKVNNRLKAEHVEPGDGKFGLPHHQAAQLNDDNRFYFDVGSDKINLLIESCAVHLMDSRVKYFSDEQRAALAAYPSAAGAELLTPVHWPVDVPLNTRACVAFTTPNSVAVRASYCEIIGEILYSRQLVKSSLKYFTRAAREKSGYREAELRFFIIIVPRSAAVFTESILTFSGVFDDFIVQVWPSCYVYRMTELGDNKLTDIVIQQLAHSKSRHASEALLHRQDGDDDDGASSGDDDPFAGSDGEDSQDDVPFSARLGQRQNRR